MKQYKVEFRVGGEADSWTVDAHDEDGAKRVIDYEYPYDHVTIISITYLGTDATEGSL